MINNYDTTCKIVIYTKDNLLIKYNVYAVKIVNEKQNEYMRLLFNSYYVLEKHLESLLSDTIYCTGDCYLDINDDILILQTCNFSPKDTFIIVVAKKVNS